MPSQPPFAEGRRWVWRASGVKKLDKRLWYDRDTHYEYEPDPRHNGVWHEINPRAKKYRDVDRVTGEPLPRYEGEWRDQK
jgi:hypothetical protein